MLEDDYFAAKTEKNSNVANNANMANVSIWNQMQTSFQFRTQQSAALWQAIGYAATAPTYNKIQCIRY